MVVPNCRLRWDSHAPGLPRSAQTGAIEDVTKPPTQPCGHAFLDCSAFHPTLMQQNQLQGLQTQLQGCEVHRRQTASQYSHKDASYVKTTHAQDNRLELIGVLPLNLPCSIWRGQG